MLQRILLFTLLAASFSAMAGKKSNVQVSHSVAAKALHHFSDDTDQHGEIEISAVSHGVSFHRQHLKSGHDTFLNNYNGYPTYTELAQEPVRSSSEARESSHLRLIFPFHYFW